jgi:hypothetical protein
MKERNATGVIPFAIFQMRFFCRRTLKIAASRSLPCGLSSNSSAAVLDGS